MFSSAAALSRPADTLAWTQGGKHAAPSTASPPLHRDDTSLEFRQLRHLTKNALQRLLCEVSRAGDAQKDWRQRRLLADLEHRLLLSARVSDALFGFTSQPDALSRRLKSLAEATAELIGGADQTIAVTVDCAGTPEPASLPTLLRIAHEMVANAVKHGLRERMIGKVGVHVTTDDRGLRLTVTDDGWGPCPDSEDGDGLAMMREMAHQIGGTITLTPQGDQTRSTLEIRRNRLR